MNIGYFINQYPKVSHTFIRREILALEKQGAKIFRYALKSNYSELVDKQDISEFQKTEFILSISKIKIIKNCLYTFLQTPKLWIKAIFKANQIGYKSERGLLRHYIYFLEACTLSYIIKKDKIEHLHSHFGTNPAVISLLTSMLTGIPYSITIHGSEEFDKPKFISLSEKIKHASFVVAISSFCKSQLYRQTQVNMWDKIKVVHCGLEQAFYSNSLPSPENKNKLVCIGRLCEQKGQSLIIDALNILKNKGIEFHLTLVGDGEMKADIEAKIIQYGLSNNIVITGWMTSDQVKSEILKAKFTLLPSFAEGLPVVIMESMSLERPVLSTYIAGVPELITHNENGWLIPAGDLDSLVDELERIFHLSNSEIEIIGKRAKNSVIERHNIDIESKKLMQHFENSVRNIKV